MSTNNIEKTNMNDVTLPGLPVENPTKVIALNGLKGREISATNGMERREISDIADECDELISRQARLHKRVMVELKHKTRETQDKTQANKTDLLERGTTKWLNAFGGVFAVGAAFVVPAISTLLSSISQIFIASKDNDNQLAQAKIGGLDHAYQGNNSEMGFHDKAMSGADEIHNQATRNKDRTLSRGDTQLSEMARGG